MREIKFIVVHHSATPDGRTFDTQAIRRFHTSWRHGGQTISAAEAEHLLAAGVTGVIPPWRKIGYHRLVESVNGEIEALVGRGEHESAAACPQGGMNDRGLHVCAVGNFDAAAPGDALIRVLIERALAPWRMVYGIPVANVVGHREVTGVTKTCPGTKFDMELLREMLR